MPSNPGMGVFIHHAPTHAGTHMEGDWNVRFLRLARHISAWSKDPSTRVGAVIARPDRTILSLGYNGFPRGCADDQSLYDDRPVKLARTVHAELNAILTASERPVGCTIYVAPLHPCPNCAGAIIQAGITRVVFTSAGDPVRWASEFDAARGMFREAGVTTLHYPMELIDG